MPRFAPLTLTPDQSLSKLKPNRRLLNRIAFNVPPVMFQFGGRVCGHQARSGRATDRPRPGSVGRALNPTIRHVRNGIDVLALS